MLLAATNEVGLAVAAAADREEERQRGAALVMRLLEGLR